MYKKLIVDADICIKLGSSKKYPFLKMPESACRQLEDLVFDKKLSW
jgi:hypothetical protein